MSENEATDDITTATEGDELAPSGPARSQMSGRAVVSILLAVVLVIAVGTGLVISKNDKDDEKNGGGSKSGAVIIATVNRDTAIKRDDFDKQVTVWISNKDFVAANAAQGAPIVDAKGKVVPAYRASLLGGEVQQVLIDQEFEKRGLKVSPDYVKQLQSQISGDPSAKGFSTEFLDDLVQRQARFQAVKESLQKPPTDAEIQAAYDQQFACESGKAVAHILVKTKAEADAVVKQLQGGASFATVAEAKSTDGSSAQGGDLGCLVTGKYVPEFEQAALAAVLDQPTAPVKSQFGYHVIKTSKFVAPPIATVRAQIVAALQQQDTAAQTFFAKLFGDAKVDIDPTVGKWGKDEQGSYTVIVATTSKPGSKPTSDLPPLTVQDERPTTTAKS